MAAFTVAGCSSDSKSSSAGTGGSAATAKKKEPLKVERIVSLPAPAPEWFVKPGHWSAAWLEATTTGTDFRGSMQAELRDTDVAPLTYPPLQFRLRYRQPLVLPVDQVRGSEQLWFTPSHAESLLTTSNLGRANPLRDLVGHVRLGDSADPLKTLQTDVRITPLADHQALFVVLAEKPEAYVFLRNLDALASVHTPNIDPANDYHFRIVTAGNAQRPLLPGSILGWTTTSCLLWDGYDPTKLSAEQRQALLDWLHWGGTLIVVGPGTLDASFAPPLAEWLPATGDGVMQLDAQALAPLDALTIKDTVPLSTNRDWTGVALKPTAGGHVLVGSEKTPLVVERRVGRGRTVVTAFRLTQSELQSENWPSFGAFVNNQLLRRPARKWRLHPDAADTHVAEWKDHEFLGHHPKPEAGQLDPWYDAALATNVRFLTRDDESRKTTLATVGAGPAVGPGMAAWRDNAAIADAVRAALREATGIFVPPASLVLMLVGAYVAAAVPLNWIVFRVFGRVEWAWAALPVIIIAFTFIVVRAAGLDLGFVRTAAEIDVVEIQLNYDRAHLTRYAALYNSLGTNYDVRGDEPSFVALPMAATSGERVEPMNRELTVARTDDAQGRRRMLEGMVVDSNSVGMIRGEQMLPLGGKLTVESLDDRRYRIVNGTSLELHDVQLAGDGGAFVMLLRPGERTEVTLGTSAARPGDEAGRRDEIDVNALWKKLQSPGSGESLRLTAWMPAVPTGLDFDPAPTQRRGKTVVVAHLRYAEWAEPQRDDNTKASVR